MNKILLNDDTQIDLPKLIESRLLVQANSGGGKSWLIRRLLEQTHGKVQQIVIDPEGEFSSLREKFDYILAGPEGDTPTDPRSAGMLAKKLLELNVSAIIDLYELHPQERKHFVKLFLEALINAPKELWHPCLVVIDEAHAFCPEQGQSEAMDAVIGLCSLGRKRKFCAVLATQRISKLHKDAAAECNNKLIGRTGLDIDRKRAGEELGFTTKDQVLSLRTLAPGEFYAFGPAISNEVIKIKSGGVQTAHATTGAFQTKIAPPTSKIKALLPQLADLPAEAKKEAHTIQGLQNFIKELQVRLAIAERKPNAPELQIQKIEVPAIGKRTLKGLQEITVGYKKLTKQSKDFMELSQKNFDKFFKEMEKITNPIISVETPKIQLLLPFPQKTTSKIDIRPPQTNPAEPQYPKLKAQTGPITEARFNPENGLPVDEQIKGPEQKILDALGWFYSVGITEPEQTAVAFLAGYTFGGGAFNNPRGSLRVKGLVEYRSTKIALTEQGLTLAKVPDTVLTSSELHQKILKILPGPERKLMEVILAVYPESISQEDLAERTGYAVGGGAFNNPKGRLKSLGLIDSLQNKQIVAKSFLFI